MQFKVLLLALAAGSSLVLAAPIEEMSIESSELAHREGASGCPKRFRSCGRCNGSSCRIAGYNYNCDVGSCLVQRGGGDGKICGSPNNDIPIGASDITCPGRK